MNRTSKAFSLFIIFFIGLSGFYLFPNCAGDEKPLPIEVSMYVDISEINVVNHTVLADVKLTIHGFPENTTTNVIVRFENDDSYEVNCSRSGEAHNGIFDFQGEIDGKYWYLVTYGELYPFDYNFVNFKLNPKYLIGSINGTTYSPNWQYSLNVVDGAVSFSGFHWQDLLNSWTPIPEISGERLIARFQRQEQNPQYLIIIPLIWFLFLVASLPFFSVSKNVKSQFYSSMLVFAPLFIFAVQSFIPPRNSLSIPEFLSFTLVLASTLMLIVTLPKYENEKQKCIWEVIGLFGSLVFSYFLGFTLFFRFLNLSTSGIAVGLILVYLTMVFGVMALWRLKKYQKYEQKQLENSRLLYEPEGLDY